MSGTWEEDNDTPEVDDSAYRELFENAADIVFTTDLSGRFLAGNKAVERLLGYTVAQARNLTWEKLVVPQHKSKARQMVRRQLSGERYVGCELDAVAVDGTVKTFEISSRALYRGTRIRGIHGIARDVSRRKEMEAQLQVARREADSANRAKSVFLARMSHEIRTPINGILGFLSLFSRTKLDDQQREYLAPIESSARQLLKIIDDILDLSRIEAGRFSVDPEPFSLQDTLNQTVRLLKPMANSKGLELKAVIPADLPRTLIGDAIRIGQVLTNLITNAIKFTKAGSVDVSVGVSPNEAGSVIVRFSVRDTGIGIPPDQVEELFEPFQQAHIGRSAPGQGAGLGLAICKSLVEAMEGRIDIDTHPGKYTCVSFEVPLRVPQTESQVSEAKKDLVRPTFGSFQGSGLRALVVDDNLINRRFLDALLRRYGIATRQASDGELAVDICTRIRFDLILMDIHMGVMDGLEATRRIRDMKTPNSSAPVVAVSADLVGGTRERLVSAGIDGFVAKPIEESALLAILSEFFPSRVTDIPSSDNNDNQDRSPAVLDRNRGVAMAGYDVELWRCSVNEFRSQLGEVLGALQGYYEAKAWSALRDAAHKLRGAAAHIGAVLLESHLGDLERRLVEGDVKGIDASLSNVLESADALLECPLD